MSFIRTTAINKILSLTARKKVIQGGTSAGKTYAIIPILINKAVKTPRLKITVVGETIPAVKDGPVDIFKSIMNDTGRWIESHWIANPMEYTFANGSRIQFKAFDTDGKAKASGKRDILFLNEANHIPFNIADALIIRSKEIFIDFNPDEEFWVHTEVLPEPNSELLVLTYKDNEACPPETIEDLEIKLSKAKKETEAGIKNGYWTNWCRVYIDGEVGTLQGAVFQNWKQVDEIPKDAEFMAYGLDFGFTNDPTAMVGVWKQNGELYVKEMIYETRLTNQDICKRLTQLGISGRDLIIADSAEPKSIEEIRQAGFYVQAARKGADSIRASINTLQEYEINVTSDSRNVLKERRAYKWATDAAGKTLNVPIDAFNHSIDALRYVALNKIFSRRNANNFF